MNEKNKVGEEQLRGFNRLSSATTRDGKIRATYTLKCKFNDGNCFTYRSDVNLANYLKQGYNKELNELEAIILKFASIKNLILECRLFDNRKPAGEDLLFHYSGLLNKILCNNLPQHYKL